MRDISFCFVFLSHFYLSNFPRRPFTKQERLDHIENLEYDWSVTYYPSIFFRRSSQLSHIRPIYTQQQAAKMADLEHVRALENRIEQLEGLRNVSKFLAYNPALRPLYNMGLT